MKHWVDVSIAGRPSERYRLDGKKTILGSSPRAKISLKGVDGLLPEHFTLTVQADGCWVEVAEEAPEPFMFDGRPSRGALVPWGQDVFHGTLRLSLPAGSEGQDKKGLSPVVWLAILVVPFVAFSFLYDGSTEGAQVSPLDHPPALFSETVSCSERGAGALARGNVAEQVARAKHARGVFDLGDAVEAVQLMREAAACYVIGGREGRAAKVTESTRAWLRLLDKDYRRALLDFELGYRTYDANRMKEQQNRLTVMLEHSGNEGREFLAWLDNRVRVEQASLAAREAEAQ